MYKNYIGERLKLLRKTCGYSQQNIANILGIDRTTYSSYERGITIPDAELCFTLSKIYNLTPIDLFDAESTIFSDIEDRVIFNFKPSQEDKDIIENIAKLTKEERQLICYFRSLTNEQRAKLSKAISEITD